MPDPPAQPGPGGADRTSDEALVRALAAGNEQAFADLVQRWGSAMLRLARAHVRSRATAEEVVQDAWLTVLGSLDRFERRSSLRTWVLGIVINLARARARAERRDVPPPPDAGEPSVDPRRFLPADHPRWPHHWAVAPAAWATPEDELLAEEARAVVLRAIDALPPSQREVIILRDLEGLDAADVCRILDLTDANQRVLLHRARSRVRSALERYLTGTEAS